MLNSGCLLVTQPRGRGVSLRGLVAMQGKVRFGTRSNDELWPSGTGSTGCRVLASERWTRNGKRRGVNISRVLLVR